MALLVTDHLCCASVKLRPVLGLWWLAHFLASGWLAFAVSFTLIEDQKGIALAAVTPLALVFQTATLSTVNLYLIMSVAVASRRSRICELMWHRRFLIDFLLSVGMMCFLLCLI